MQPTTHTGKRHHRQVTLTGLVALAVLAGLSVAAGAKANTASGDTSLAAAAKATLAKYTAIPKFPSPGPAVDAAKVKGKTILVVSHDMVADELVGIADGVKQAGKAVGDTVKVFNGQGTVSTIEQGIQRGILNHVGAIVLNGVDPQLVPNSVSAAHKAGIPIIVAANGLHSENKNVFGFSSPNYKLNGTLMGDVAIATGKTKVIYLKFNNPSAPDILAGIKSAFTKCTDCKVVTTLNVEPTKWPTQVPTTVEAAIKANPDAQLVIAADDTQGLFAVTGIRDAGSSDVFVVAVDGSGAAPLKLVQKGPIFIADFGQSSVWTGWGCVDQALRAMTGMSPGNDATPTRWLNAETLKGVDVSNPDAVYGDSYAAGYKKVWGVL